jgi:hypothetical protein
MHRRCTEDAQIVLFRYDVGATQTHTKDMCNKIRKADVPMKWAPNHRGESKIDDEDLLNKRTIPGSPSFAP